MSKIYKYINENGEEQLYVSKEYVDVRIKALREAIISHIKNIDDAHIDHSADIDVPFDNVSVEKAAISNEVKVNAKDVEEDSTHRFTTDEDIKKFRSKPTLFEVQRMIDDAENNLQAVFNDQYIRILNIPGAVDKLIEVAELIKSNANLDKLVDIMENKLSKKDLMAHIESSIHLTEDDRNALNIILEKFNDGTLQALGDNAKYADIARVSNNSSAIEGLDLRSLHKCKAEELVIGLGNKYNGRVLDVVMNDPNKEFELLDLNYISGAVCFKTAEYNIDNFNIDRKNNDIDLIIYGCGSGTMFNIYNMNLNGRVTMRDCKVRNGIINVKTNNTFENIIFENCDIKLSGCNFVTFNKCRFTNCSFKFEVGCSYLRFVDNYISGNKMPKYINKNCTFRDNIQVV